MGQRKVEYDQESSQGTIHSPDETGHTIMFQSSPADQFGMQNEDLIALLILRIQALNEKLPCRENSLAITKLQESLFWLQERTRAREEQGIEGRVGVGHNS